MSGLRVEILGLARTGGHPTMYFCSRPYDAAATCVRTIEGKHTRKGCHFWDGHLPRHVCSLLFIEARAYLVGVEVLLPA